MTRQMADDEALRVLGLAILAARRGSHVSADDLAEARAAVAALQAERDQQCTLLAAGMERELNFQIRAERAEAERDALRRDVDKYRVPWQEYDERTEWVQRTAKPKELGMHRADVLRLRIEHAEQRAERAEAALEALRGQVAGLVAKWHREADEIAKNNWLCNSNSIRARADELATLLAIKESGNAPQV